MHFRYTLFCFSVLCIGCTYKENKYTQTIISTPVTKENSLTYRQLISLVDSTRKSFGNNYTKETETVSVQAKAYFNQIIGSDVFRHWRGTPWDFNGITTDPQKGNIACGFFVTTVLRDVGIQLNRHKLAVCPSLQMMRALTSSKEIRNLSRSNYSQFCDWLKKYGKSVFIVGLDYHTGFIVNDGKEVWFIHSNYINRVGVVKEKVNLSQALQVSKTRYVTCLTDSKKFLESWLLH